MRAFVIAVCIIALCRRLFIFTEASYNGLNPLSIQPFAISSDSENWRDIQSIWPIANIFASVNTDTERHLKYIAPQKDEMVIELSNCIIPFLDFLNLTLSQPITHTRLENCNITSNPAATIRNISLIGAKSKIKVMDLSYNVVSTAALKDISLILAISPYLEKFIFDGNKLSVNQIKILLSKKNNLSTLKHLSLSQCVIEDEHAHTLSLFLKSNRKITHLNLSLNKLSADGYSALDLAFQSGACRELEHLDLSYNPIGELGVMQLCRTLEADRLPRLSSLVIKQVQHLRRFQ